MSDQNKEFTGSPCPKDPDNFWIDDKTGERVNAETGERTTPKEDGSYAVIYDVGEGEDALELYYESFNTPEEAMRVFRDVFPKEDKAILNARLVKILGSIDAYEQSNPVMATMRTDDGAINIEFSIEQWLINAENEDILNLARCGWRGDYPADEVSDYYRNDTTKGAYDYLENHLLKDTKNAIGFETAVNSKEAIEWIKVNKPDVYTILEKEGLHA